MPEEKIAKGQRGKFENILFKKAEPWGFGNSRSGCFWSAWSVAFECKCKRDDCDDTHNKYYYQPLVGSFFRGWVVIAGSSVNDFLDCFYNKITHDTYISQANGCLLGELLESSGGCEAKRVKRSKGSKMSLYSTINPEKSKYFF